jgi:DNA-binding transcriptional ArsR family regulator
MTQNSSKIQGKFYPLQHEEWLRAWNELKPAEIKILYYLRAVDPFGEKELEFGVTALAKKLQLSKSTVSVALRKLADQGWIDLELVRVKIKLKSVRSDECCSLQRTGVRYSEQAFATANDNSLQRTEVCSTEQTELETLIESEFQNPKTNIDIKDFKDSLSEAEREKFLEFANKKASELPTPPTLPGKWIETHFEELRELFEKQESSMGSTHCGGGGSTNVLDFENWDDSTHTGQYHTLMSLGLAKFCENTISKAWYEWATVKHPERFVNVPE